MLEGEDFEGIPKISKDDTFQVSFPKIKNYLISLELVTPSSSPSLFTESVCKSPFLKGLMC